MERIESLSLLKSGRDWLYFLLFASLVATFSLLFSYQRYLDFRTFDSYTLEGIVTQQAQLLSKEQMPFWRLSLDTPSMRVTTLSFLPLGDLVGQKVRITIDTDTTSFIDYLTHTFAQSDLVALLPHRSLQWHLIDATHAQHSHPLMQNLYGALFFLEPISPHLRTILTTLGVNHLAALSGYHLGFLATLLWGVLWLVYKPLHRRFWPYRLYHRDAMFFIIVVLWGYIHLLGYSPSLVRAFGMLIVGFVLYDRGLKLVSFSMLSVTVLLLLALFPSLLFSIAFWLSALGVWGIFMLLHLMPHAKAWQLFLAINIALFFLLTPLGVGYFGQISLWQWASIPLSMLFGIFYPLAMGLHALGWGEWLDGVVLALFEIPMKSATLALNGYYISLYLALLLASALHRWLMLFALVAGTLLTCSFYYKLL
ncbi:MAG: hypothetical protein KU37_07785 [Sulfuricurvum sp. PC08-66]|nr:MAG: hypothetical protein KU37_07785 [Sulfuricurvum sp. PC08-66]